MSSYALAPVAKQQFCDQNGIPYAGGQLFTYTAGTSTPAATYTDSTGATPNANPIVLDSAGRANIWLPTSGSFKFVLEDASSNVIWTVDNISEAISGFTPGSPQTFTIADNQSSATNITGLLVAHATNQAVTIEYTIKRTDGTNYRREIGFLYLSYDQQNGWVLNRQAWGADSLNIAGSSMTITAAGQVQYQSDSMGGTYNGQITWLVYSAFATESF